MTAPLSITRPGDTVQALHTLADRSKDAREARRLRSMAMVLAGGGPPCRGTGPGDDSAVDPGLGHAVQCGGSVGVAGPVTCRASAETDRAAASGGRGLRGGGPGSRRRGVPVAPV